LNNLHQEKLRIFLG